MGSPRVLVLGATGMLGHALLSGLDEAGYETWGSVRVPGAVGTFPAHLVSRLRSLHAEDPGSLDGLLADVAPQVVINAIGLVPQRPEGSDPLRAIAVNALFPHRVAAACAGGGIRLVHVSTNCVFSGRRGGYAEGDEPDPVDLYGRTKLLGEPAGPRGLTLRTSFIGHERGSAWGLLEWFLAQRGSVPGHTRAIFSGLTTGELTRVLAAHVLPDETLCGMYHVASAPISKHDLLGLLRARYAHAVEIRATPDPAVDRSLDGAAFARRTGYQAPPWIRLVEDLHRERSVTV